MDSVFEVVNGLNAYYLYIRGDYPGNSPVACMGDGVNAMFATYDDDGELEGFLTVGDEGFAKQWQNEVNDTERDYLEAYFPKLADLRLLENTRQAIPYGWLDLPERLRTALAIWVYEL